jgi:hypothetical protein
MNRLRNDLVLGKWKKGEAANSHTGALHTDGTSLFSYHLKIGHRAESGACVLGDFTSPGGGYQSQTTSCHVGKARSFADHTMHPVVFNNSEFKRNDG